MSPSFLRFLLRAAFFLLALFSFLPFSNLFLHPLESAYPRLSLKEIPQGDAVVVLAGMIRTPVFSQQDLEFTGSVDRILMGEKLLSLQKAPVLLISGSSSRIMQKGKAEAVILKNWQKQRQAFSGKILAEAESRNTAESALAVEQIAAQKKWKTILLVSSAYHMFRSVRCFQKVLYRSGRSLKIIPVPVDYQGQNTFAWPEAAFPSLTGLVLSAQALREYAGIAAYRLSGKI